MVNHIKIGKEDGLSTYVYTIEYGEEKVNYYYVQPHLLSQDIQLYFSGIMAQIGMGIETKLLLEKLKEIEDTVMEMDSSNLSAKKKEVIKITTNIETRVSNLIPTELLIAACACVVFTEGEAFTINPRHIIAKKQAILEDSAATAFFTHFALVTLINYKEASNNSLQDYLRMTNFQEIVG